MAEKRAAYEYYVPPELRPFTRKVKPLVKGLNTGIAQLAGFPVYLANLTPTLINLLPGKQGMKPFSEKPLGGAQTFKDLMAAGNIDTYKDLQSIPKDEYGAGVTGMLAGEALLSLVPASKLIQQLTKGKKVNLPQPSAGGVDLSKRDLFKKAGAAAVSAAMAPSILREAGDIAGAAVKTAKVVPKGAIISRARDLASDLTNSMIKDLFMSSKERKRLGLPEKPDRTLSDKKTVELNTLLEDFLKGKTYEDLMKLSKNDKAELYNLKQTSHHQIVKKDKFTGRDKEIEYGDSAGDPLRSKEYGPLLDKVFKDSDIGVWEGKYTNRIPNFGDPPPRNLLADPSAFDDAFGLKMFPSEKIIKNMVPTGPKSPSLFPTEAKKGRQLLIVSCGSDKCPDVGNMKALDRYLGPVFSSIRKAGVPPNVDVAILSAKHGLIRSDTPIKKYDQLMTDEVRDKFFNNPEEMGKILNTMQGYDNVVVQGGENYRQVIAKAAGDLPYKEFRGGIGEQRSQVGKYLAEEGRRGYFRAEEGFKKPKDTANLFHFTLSKSNKPIEEFSMDVLEKTRKKSGEDLDMFYTTGDDNVDLLGLHVGSPSEASGRGSNLSQVYRQRLEYAKKKFPEKIETKTIRDGEQTVSKVKGDPYDDFEGLEGGTTYGLEVDVSKPFLKPNSDDGVWSEGELSVFVQNKKNRDKLNKVEVEKGIHSKEYEEVNSQEIAKIRQDLAKEGYTNIPYVYGGGFSPEKVRGDNIKQILLIDRPNKEKIILSQTDGKPMAKGGIAGLSDVARDMFKGPKGIGTYESFMVG